VTILSGESSMSSGSTPDDLSRMAVLGANLPEVFDAALGRPEIADSLANSGLDLKAEALRQRAWAERDVICAPAEDLLAEYLDAGGTKRSSKRHSRWFLVFWQALVLLVVIGAASQLWSASALLNVLVVVGAVIAWFIAFLVVLGIYMGVSTRDKEKVLAEWREAVLVKGVLPLFRSMINERVAFLRWPTMEVIEAPGLDNVRQLSLVVETGSTRRFRQVLGQVRAGAIGIAGSRGVGKTTLLEQHLSGQRSGIAVLVPAPVRYDAREFVLHLYATLCQAALHRWSRSRNRWWWPAARFSSAQVIGGLLLVGLLVVGGWTLTGIATKRKVTGAATFFAAVRGLSVPAFALWPTFLLWLMAVLVVVFAVVSAARGRRRGGVLAAVRETNRRLSRIRFLQTKTTGWSGTLTVPGGQVGHTGQAQRAELPLTYPEIVAELRRYLEALVGWLPTGAGVTVVIDELDKIESAEHAQNFINEIKGVLGVDGTQFVITVSEDALAAFERRGLPVRDAFDSTFDEVVWIEALNVAESCTLLQKRVIGLSDLFCALAHCMSGGLPRDLIRTARLMRSIAGTERIGIEALCPRLVGADLERKIRAYQVATGELSGEAGTTGFVRTLRGLTADPVALHAALGPLLSAGSGGALRALGLQAAVYVYHCATVLEVFTADLDRAAFDQRRDMLDELARAKQSLATLPEVAWQMLDEVRATWGLTAVAPLDHS
jgi:hypothetical protein